jgi:hypothetical protein
VVNKYLYKAQVLNLGKVDMGGPLKKIRWREEVPKRAILKAMGAIWASSCASNIQSFMWLMLNHALAVGSLYNLQKPAQHAAKKRPFSTLCIDANLAGRFGG